MKVPVRGSELRTTPCRSERSEGLAESLWEPAMSADLKPEQRPASGSRCTTTPAPHSPRTLVESPSATKAGMGLL